MYSYFGLLYELARNTTKWSYDFALRYRRGVYFAGYGLLLSTFIGTVDALVDAAFVAMPPFIGQLWSLSIPDNFIPIVTLLATVRITCVIFLAKVHAARVASSALGSGHTDMPPPDPVSPSDCPTCG